MLLFREVEDSSVGQQTFGWNGPWPPPPEMLIVVGRETGMTAIVEPDESNKAALRQLEDNGCRVIRYVLNSASQIPEPAPADAHWFRGAEYLAVPEAGREQ